MAFVNLPPNLQDIFGSINDRIAKLETGPNQPMYTAEYAQSVAESAQGGSLTAQTTAAAALAQSTIAQAQATSAQAAAAGANTTASTALAQSTIAQAQALSAQATAAAANTTASTASAQATQASAQAVTAQATANTAMLQATVASAQAITAQNTANAAASQATTAQATANIANTNATVAQTTANGKSTVTYSTSAPGVTANRAGDIWYQYGTAGTYANKVIAQFSGNGGTSWTPVTVSGLIIANIDAGAITTGTLSAITITAGTGANSFNVSSSGVMSAQGAYIKGNITADSGTFNGQVNATSGYFGSPTNGWQINAGGIAGLGSGYISGGAIQGTSFNNGNGTFFVNSSGDLVAQSVYVKGAVLGTSGYFGNGTNGWQIDSNGITGLGSGYIAGGAIQGTSFNNGNGTFFVNSAGAVVAQSIYAKGAILGTSGYFGSATNGWQIDSNGITGIGSGYIAGGAIQGTSFNNGNGTFYVGPTGDMVAQNVYVKGAVLGTSGYFGNVSNGWQIDSTGITGIGSGYIAGGTIQGTTFNNGSGTFQVSSGGAVTATSGTIAGWTLSSTAFTNSGADTFLVANPGSDGLAYSTIGRGIMRRLQLNGASGTTLGTNVLAVGGTMSVDSDSTLAGNIRSVGTASTTTGSTANMFINSVSGLMARSTASSQRYKHDIVNLIDVPELDPNALYELPVRAFRFNKDYLPETDDRAEVLVPGFIAEEVDAIYPAAVDYNDGQVETWNDRMLIPAMLLLIQQQNERIKTLENPPPNP